MTQEENKNTSTNKEEDGLPSFSESVHYDINTPSETKTACNKEKCHCKPIKKSNMIPIINTLISGLMLFATVCLALFTYRLVSDNRNLINETIHNNKINADNTHRALDQTDNSLKLAQDNFVIQNRPYLNVEEFTRNGLYPDQQGIIIGTIRNQGKTPALNVKIFSKMDIYNSIDYCEFKIGTFKDSFSIAPNAPYKIYGMKSISNGESDSLMLQKIFLYYFGKITYNDRFGGDYYTIFCVRLKFDRDTPEARFDYHSCFNDMK